VNESSYQHSPYHTALRCLFLVARHHGVEVTPEQLAATDPANTLASVRGVMRGVGIRTTVLMQRSWQDLITLGTAYPAIAVGKDGGWFIIVGAVPDAAGETAPAVLDPRNEGSGVVPITRERLDEIWGGTLLLCKIDRADQGKPPPFGFRWFLPEIFRNGRFLRDVAIAALTSNLMSYGTPLLYQTIIDKVINHRSYNTLFAVILLFCVITLFDGLFSYVRQYLMLFTSNKIDASLGSRTFRHLLSLPVQFFEANSTGVLTRHMQQTERIRGFLTGRLFQMLLDTAAFPLLVTLLCMYSGKLTVIVVAYSLAMAAVIGILLPTFRMQLLKLYQAEGGRQAHLVETIHGMSTVKSLALEAPRQLAWDDKVAAAVRRHQTVGRIGILANVATTALEKMMQVTVLGIGATSVFNGDMSLGALVAFTMLSGRVTGPLVQIVGLVNEYQDTALSVRMLGTVMDHPAERDPNQRGLRPRLSGQVEFDRVTFRYSSSATPALDRVSFKIEEGQIIGVVGRSGSGKTTVTRLIQNIHTAQEGIVRFDGVDIRHIDLPHLRRSMGVVLQDSFLFSGTIRENIAAAKPDASLAEVMQAATLAGAAEFIDRLPQSYETRVEESATNFSGGQRQRISIARALLLRPRLLIFDEATSALDPESEAIIQNNLNEIGRDRTMIIVSHRLSSLVQAHAIMVLEQGRVLDLAPHNTLLERCDIYRHLWQQQNRHLQP
jgi:ATP-binding cassette subfamily B protein